MGACSRPFKARAASEDGELRAFKRWLLTLTPKVFSVQDEDDEDEPVSQRAVEGERAKVPKSV
eukprot:5751829-Amphidinium_carterae.1